MLFRAWAPLRGLVAVGASLGVTAYCGAAWAYCRATTCDPTTEDCGVNAHGCQTKGAPIVWKGGDVELFVDENGSELRGISGRDTQRAVETVLTTWMSADCPGGGHPSFSANTELAAKLKAQFNADGPNQSVITYMDDVWPYEANAVAKTLLGFSLPAGDILDADVVFNSSEFSLSLDPASADDIDVQAVLTHEIGHVLGLAHSDVPGATMQPEAPGFATAELETLEPDDMAGICAIYPPTKKTATSHPASSSSDPGNGASSDDSASSGCSVTRAVPRERFPVLALLAIAGVSLRRRARPWMPLRRSRRS